MVIGVKCDKSGERDCEWDTAAGVARLEEPCLFRQVKGEILPDRTAQCLPVEVGECRLDQRHEVVDSLRRELRELVSLDATRPKLLVHMEVEQPGLGLGDTRHGIAVDAHQLQDRPLREADVESELEGAQSRHVLVVADTALVEDARRFPESAHDGWLELVHSSGGLERVDRA